MSEQPDAFERRAQAVLRQSAESLDGATRSRLNQARHAALEAVRQRERRPWVWLMPATGALAAAIFAVLIVNPARQPVETVAPVDEFEILTSEDSLEFYRDMEFYAWLDSVLEEEAAADNDV